MLKKIEEKFKIGIKKVIDSLKKIKTWKYEKIVLAFLIPIGLLYIFLMLPSQVPDERSHILRAYEISEGVLIGRKDSKAIVPKDFLTKLRPNMESYTQFTENIIGKTDYDDRIEIEDSAATNSFILYSFSSIGFLIARIFGFNIIIGCMLAKIMNFLIFCIGTYYALKKLPFGKYVFTAIIFMPMFLHQATSISADSIINTMIMFFIAYVLNLYFKKERITKNDSIVLVILSCLIGISKYVYTPIVFISAIMIWSKNIEKKQKIITLSLMFLLPILLAFGYYLFTSSYETVFNDYFTTNNVDGGEQIKYIMNNPFEYVKTVANTLKTTSTTYINQMVGGILGWLCIYVPKFVVGIYLLVLLASCFIEENKFEFNFKQKAWGFLISGGIVLLIMTGMYITWTGVGSDVIQGVQGRYFIPILFLALLCLCKKDNYIKIKNIQYKLPIILCLLNLPVLYTIYQFFNK